MTEDMDGKTIIVNGRAVLGIELGSTRIKAVLLDEGLVSLAHGSHSWENKFVDGLWTYSLDDVWAGLQDCYANLRRDVMEKYGVEITRLRAVGFSGMMHGYLPFDKDGRQLAAFRTWRNTNTVEAAAELTELLEFNIPLRWSISHLYQAVLDGEEHVADISYITTLAGYVHWKLTGKRVMGVGEASGMFPIDPETKDYDSAMVAKFDDMMARREYRWRLRDILPTVLCAGDDAGTITAEGARLLDPSGNLQPGTVTCPPEGDAGTGMVATNAVRPRTGNVSCGTSSFSMIVLEHNLKHHYPSIDIVTTPDGWPVAMVHCNNCTSDINAWVDVFRQGLELFGCDADTGTLFTKLFNVALEGEADCGGLLSYNFYSGEPVVALAEGHPMVMRFVNGKFSLANLMRSHLYGAVAVLKVGNDILLNDEHVALDKLTGHGGFFNTPLVGQKILTAVFGTPITVMKSAGEGGAWGIALLAAYSVDKKDGQHLADYLDEKVFAGNEGVTLAPDKAEVEDFNRYYKSWIEGLDMERAASNVSNR